MVDHQALKKRLKVIWKWPINNLPMDDNAALYKIDYTILLLYHKSSFTYHFSDIIGPVWSDGIKICKIRKVHASWVGGNFEVP